MIAAAHFFLGLFLILTATALSMFAVLLKREISNRFKK